MLVLGWAAASTQSRGALPRSGGTYVEGVIGAPPQQINPLFAATEGPERDLTSLIFSGLTRRGPDGSPQPDLAENWVTSTDGTTFTFNLRRDVRWQDGTPFTADDVLFTAAAYAAPGVKGDPATAEVWRRAKVSKLGDYTVLFEFPDPFLPFLSYSDAGLLPHRLASDTPEQLVSDPFNRHPVGTGPYRLVSLSSTDAVLRPNPGFELGAPYIGELRLRFFADAQTLATALRNHTVDGGVVPAPVSDADAAALRQSGHSLVNGDRPAYSLVYLNLNLAQFQDPAVRRAISLATDRVAIVRDQLNGQASVADVPLAQGSWSGSGASVPYDPAAARAALDQAGWVQDADGVRRHQGISLSFTLQTTAGQRQAIADELAAQWKLAGIDAQVQVVDEQSLVADTLLAHKYEAVLYGWDPGPDPDPFPAWHSSQASGQGGNLSGYSNDRADQLLEAARQAPDQADRADIYAAFAGVFRQDVPAIILFFPRYAYVASDRLIGLQLGLMPSASDRFDGVERWSVRTRSR